MVVSAGVGSSPARWCLLNLNTHRPPPSHRALLVLVSRSSHAVPRKSAGFEHRISSHRISSHRIASHTIASHRIPSHSIASLIASLIASHSSTSHPIPSHPVASSHRISSHLNRIASFASLAPFASHRLGVASLESPLRFSLCRTNHRSSRHTDLGPR